MQRPPTPRVSAAVPAAALPLQQVPPLQLVQRLLLSWVCRQRPRVLLLS